MAPCLSSNTRNREGLLTAHTVLDGDKLEAPPVRPGAKRASPCPSFFFDAALEAPANAVREEKEAKKYTEGEEMEPYPRVT